MCKLKSKLINIKGALCDLSEPKVMGVLNVTPDSFYDGSRVESEKAIIERTSEILGEGADFIDVGGYSSRPGADEVSEEVESSRVLSAMKIISREFPTAVVSVDTFRSKVAERAVSEYGAAIINDITGGEGDSEMFGVVAKYNVPYILMHMQGVPKTMQNNPVYGDIIADILQWFAPRIHRLVEYGVNDIIIDPGFGFGKTVNNNFELLRRLRELETAALPVLAGLSRKSMIWKTLGTAPAEALNGSTVLNTAALLAGADILRVHDVKAAREAVKLTAAILNTKKSD
jgi:dihydropteroate synthase